MSGAFSSAATLFHLQRSPSTRISYMFCMLCAAKEVRLMFWFQVSLPPFLKAIVAILLSCLFCRTHVILLRSGRTRPAPLLTAAASGGKSRAGGYSTSGTSTHRNQLSCPHAFPGAAHDAPSAIFDGDWLIDVFFKAACVTRDNVIDLHNILQGIQQKFAAISHIANVNLISLGALMRVMCVLWETNAQFTAGTMQQVLRQVCNSSCIC